MARMLLRRPLLVWTLVLLLVAHHAVARTLTSEGEGGKSESEKREDHRDEKREDHGEKSDKEKEHEKSPRCNKKNTYACEDGSELVCGNTPNKDDDVCPDGTTFCRIDDEKLVNGQMTCAGKTVNVVKSGGGSSPYKLTLTSTGGTFAEFVGAKGGPAYCKQTPALADYKSTININLPTQLTPTKSYKDFSNLAFCFKPCPCSSCGLQEAFACESFRAGTAVPSFAKAECGAGCAPVIASAFYGRSGITGDTPAASTGPVVNGVKVNSACTCQTAGYCSSSPTCTSSSPGCTVPQCSGGTDGLSNVTDALQRAINTCKSSNPCLLDNAFTCTSAWCPGNGVYQFWANNPLNNGDPCVGTYKYMVFSWRCGPTA